MFQPGHTPSHTGKITTTDPIRGEDIAKVRATLTKTRDIALWSVGTNSALRGSDLTSMTWDEVEDDGTRFTLFLRERKTQKLRKIVLNPQTSADLRAWRAESDNNVIFPMTVAYLGRLIKTFCKNAGVDAKRVASHSLRKTWVRAHADRGAPLRQLMWALNHSNERQTAVYCGLLGEEVQALYEHAV